MHYAICLICLYSFMYLEYILTVKFAILITHLNCLRPHLILYLYLYSYINICENASIIHVCTCARLIKCSVYGGLVVSLH